MRHRPTTVTITAFAALTFLTVALTTGCCGDDKLDPMRAQE